MDVFFAILFAAGFGFGAAYMIMATMLVKEHSIGDDSGEMCHYCSGITITDRYENRSNKPKLVPLEKPKVQLAPRGTAPVEKPKKWTDNLYPMIEDPERTYRPQVPCKRDNASSFPRSFHDV